MPEKKKTVLPEKNRRIVPEKSSFQPEKNDIIVPEKLYFQPEKKIKKVGEKIKNGRENRQKSGKKWARKPIFAREKNENMAKNRFLGQNGVSRPKKKHWQVMSECD